MCSVIWVTSICIIHKWASEVSQSKLLAEEIRKNRSNQRSTMMRAHLAHSRLVNTRGTRLGLQHIKTQYPANNITQLNYYSLERKKLLRIRDPSLRLRERFSGILWFLLHSDFVFLQNHGDSDDSLQLREPTQRIGSDWFDEKGKEKEKRKRLLETYRRPTQDLAPPLNGKNESRGQSSSKNREGLNR